MSSAQFEARRNGRLRQHRDCGPRTLPADRPELGVGLSYERVPEGHWLYDVDFDAFEFVWSAESLTRMAMLLSEEVHISAVERTLQPDARPGA